MDELEISGKRYISTKRAGKDHKYHSDYIGQLIRAKKVVGQKVGRAWYVDADSLAEYLGAEVQKNAGVPAARMVPTPETKTATKAIEADPIKIETIEPESKIENIEETFVETVQEVIEEVLEVVEEEKVQEPNASYIPIKISQTETPIYRTTKEAREARGGLRYIADEGPLLPQVKKQITHSNYDMVASKLTHDDAPTTHVHIRNIEPVVERDAPIRFREERSFNSTAVIAKRQPVRQSNIALLAVRAGVICVLGAIIFTVAAFISTHLLFTETIDGGGGASASYSVK